MKVKPLARECFELPNGFISGNSDGCRQIQRAQGLLVEPREMYASFCPDLLMEPVWTSMAFVAEEEGVSGLESG